MTHQDRSRLDLALEHLASAQLLARSIGIERVAVEVEDIEVVAEYVRRYLAMFDDIESRNLSVRRVTGGLPPTLDGLRWAVEADRGISRARTMIEAHANVDAAIAVARSLNGGATEVEDA